MKYQPIRMRPSTLKPQEDTSVHVSEITGTLINQPYSRVTKSGDVIRAASKEELIQKVAAHNEKDK